MLSPNTAIASGFGAWVFSMTPLPASTSEKSRLLFGSNS